MQKEKLTKEIIKEDFAVLYKRQIKIALFMLPEFILIVLLLWFILSYGDISDVDFKTWIMLAISAALAAITVRFVAIWIRYKNLINSDKFQIIADVLSKKENTFTARPRQPYKLTFLHCGVYSIPDGRNNASSEEMMTSKAGIYNYAELGDIFYLVICGKDIALAYNSRMFEPVGLEIEKAYIDEPESDLSDE